MKHYKIGDRVLLMLGPEDQKVEVERTVVKPIFVWADEIEDGALEQLLDAAAHPCLFHHVAAMPDVHQGYGLPIGGVVAFEGAVSPYCVGKDKGCGMYAIQTNILWEKVTRDEIIKLRRLIRKAVPMGPGVAHKEPQEWDGFDKYLVQFTAGGEFAKDMPEWFTDKGWAWIRRTLGTLGGGNHFIEIQAGSDGYLWIMIHSGSRKLGDTLCGHHHAIAVKKCKQWRVALPTDRLAFLPTDTPEAKDYLRDLEFALAFAKENRLRMAAECIKAMIEVFGVVGVLKRLDVHHNYAALEHHIGRDVWVHRKGATSAKKDEYGIIPGDMGSPSYIVRGKGNLMAFMSCPHGAGRAFGIKAACRTLDADEEAAKMDGIVYDTPGTTVIKVKGEKMEVPNLGESVGAYKDIATVMKNAETLCDIEVELRPLGNIKGGKGKMRR